MTLVVGQHANIFFVAKEALGVAIGAEASGLVRSVDAGEIGIEIVNTVSAKEKH